MCKISVPDKNQSHGLDQIPLLSHLLTWPWDLLALIWGSFETTLFVPSRGTCFAMFLMLEHKAQAVTMWTARSLHAGPYSVLPLMTFTPPRLLWDWVLLWAFYKIGNGGLGKRSGLQGTCPWNMLMWTINFSNSGHHAAGLRFNAARSWMSITEGGGSQATGSSSQSTESSLLCVESSRLLEKISYF